MGLMCMLPFVLLSAGPPARVDSAVKNVATVSTGESFDVQKMLLPERPTILVFYQETSAADKEFVEEIKKQIATTRVVIGLRLAQLRNLDAPAAKEFEIRETPTMIAYDRFGNTLVRTSKVEELIPAIGKALRMARIKWVDEHDPEAEKVYAMMGGGKQPIPGIIKTMSLRPDLMQEVLKLGDMAHFSDGFLPRRTKEMIATYVSSINHCKF